jgi:hypothetical protein
MSKSYAMEEQVLFQDVIYTDAGEISRKHSNRPVSDGK